MRANARSHFELPFLNVELGLWMGLSHNYYRHWLRFFDAEGAMLPNHAERADRANDRAEKEIAPGVNAAIQTEQAALGAGVTSNRLMVRLKMKF